MSSRKKFANARVLKFEKDQNYSESIKALDLNLFPLIDDFEIVIKDCGKYMGLHISYYSKKLRKTIASYPWWDNVNRDLMNMCIDDIPIGSIENPYNDLEQSWQLVIWVKGDFVYVIEGDEPCCIEFPRYFKVEKCKYINEWQRILNISK